MSIPLDPERRAELIASLAAVRERLSDACASVGRDPRMVTLVAVTKGFPASDVLSLATIGVSDFGESRDQEARVKVAEVEGAGVAAPRWHFVGQLQTNKCRSIARYAHTVHSVDREQVVAALAAGAERAGRRLDVFAQVRLDRAPGRAGVAPENLVALADQIVEQAMFRLRGVMAIAPLDEPADPAFERLATLSAELAGQHPEATAISAGMSADLEAAIRHGATHVRIGSALLGRRSGTFG